MQTIAALKAEAESLGLTGDKIAEYCIHQQNIAREERAKERELESERLNMQERQNIRDHERRLAELSSNPSNIQLADNVNKPKLSMFTSGDDITSFSVRFERIAELLSINKDTYAVRLGSLLSGRAIDIYASLPPEVTANYGLLKKALLTGFSRTPDTYRKDFRACKILPNETYEQFSVRLTRHLDLWLQSREVENSYEALRSFTLADQFMSSLIPELRLFIKEHNAFKLEDMIKLADNWSTARNAYPKLSKKIDGNENKKCIAKGVSNSRDFSNVKCFSCGKVGHLKAKCPQISINESVTTRDYRKIKCHACGSMGHIKSNCPQNPIAQAFKGNLSRSSGDTGEIRRANIRFCLSDETPKKFVSTGTVNGANVSTIWRDTGCSNIIVSEEVLPDIDVTSCKTIKVSDYLGREDNFPIVRCFINCKFYNGWADAIRAPIKFCSVLIGNVEGVVDEWQDDSSQIPGKFPVSNAVQTRARKIQKPLHPLVLPEINPIKVTPAEFIDMQSTCLSLEDIRSKVASGEVIESSGDVQHKFMKENNLIYRVCIKSKYVQNVGVKTLVIPTDCRHTILSVAHESPLAGHFSHRKTERQIKINFYWPGMSSDIKNFCRSCQKCQVVAPRGRVKHVPLEKMPIITEPFSRVAIDLVGPIDPCSSEGHRYILTLIDYATGFPEAVPLREIDSIAIAEALLQIFSRVGIQREILSDRAPVHFSTLRGVA